MSFHIFLNKPSNKKAKIELNKKKNIGKDIIVKSSFTLNEALKTIAGVKIYNKIFAIEFLSQFKNRVLNAPKIILRYKGIIFYCFFEL